jgi:hypothetical protein
MCFLFGLKHFLYIVFPVYFPFPFYRVYLYVLYICVVAQAKEALDGLAVSGSTPFETGF